MIAMPVAIPGRSGNHFQRRDRCDITEAQADAADQTITDREQGQVVESNAEAGDHEPAAKAARTRKHRLAGAVTFHPFAKDGRRQAEQDQTQRIRAQHDGRDAPVILRGMVEAEDTTQRNVENAEAVNLPNAHLDGDRGGWNEPAIVSSGSDRVLPVEKRKHGEGNRSDLGDNGESTNLILATAFSSVRFSPATSNSIKPSSRLPGPGFGGSRRHYPHHSRRFVACLALGLLTGSTPWSGALVFRHGHFSAPS
jgi:hypothetical protein